MTNLLESENVPSELFTSQWLVCAPGYYGVEYEINPWMHKEKAPDKTRAVQQWQRLHHTLLRLGAWLEYVEQRQGLPDMVFTANGALVVGKNVVLPRFRPQERQGEVPFFRAWFEQRGFSVFEPEEHAFEGEGDALFVGDTLVGGYGMRSDREVYPEVAALLGIKKFCTVELIDPRFYHLDTCFCPLDSHHALAYLPAFSKESQEVLASISNIIPVPEADALRFVCNSVVLGRDVVIPAGSATTEVLLREKSFQPWPVELDEFLKAGGAAKCLSLRLDRHL
jgi:N-dimethylarginine dimethylaminohydrolase